jgi:hypothetical protein
MNRTTEKLLDPAANRFIPLLDGMTPEDHFWWSLAGELHRSLMYCTNSINVRLPESRSSMNDIARALGVTGRIESNIVDINATFFSCAVTPLIASSKVATVARVVEIVGGNACKRRQFALIRICRRKVDRPPRPLHSAIPLLEAEYQTHENKTPKIHQPDAQEIPLHEEDRIHQPRPVG